MESLSLKIPEPWWKAKGLFLDTKNNGEKNFSIFLVKEIHNIYASPHKITELDFAQIGTICMSKCLDVFSKKWEIVLQPAIPCQRK